MVEKTQIDGDYPAFPISERMADGSYYCSHQGMSLRDYFAGQALAGIFTHLIVSRASDQDLDPATLATAYARGAYGLADAMLLARGEG
jgi:hypothetical protein